VTIEGGAPERGVDRIADRVVDDSARFGTPDFYAAVGRAFVTMCAVVPIFMLLQWIDRPLDGQLKRWGEIDPRELSGLDGILVAPLLHVDYAHALGNSIALILLGTFVLAGGGRRFVYVTLFIAVISGVLVWLFSPAPVVGASGVLMGYLGFLLTRGIVERSLWNIGVSLLAILLFGWQIGSVMPGQERVSWQAHLFGFAAGVVAALIFRRRRLRRADVAGGSPSDPTTTRVDLETTREQPHTA
jgi:membrane associated rhomboid family serine protease